MTLEKARGRMSHFYDAEALLADLKALIEAGGHSQSEVARALNSVHCPPPTRGCERVAPTRASHAA